MTTEAQLSGRIGPFSDPATRMTSGGALQGVVRFTAPGNAQGLVPQMQSQMLTAVTSVLAQKLATGQVAIPTMPASLPHFLQEIVAASGVQGLGIVIQSLDMKITMDPPGQAQGLPPDPMQAMGNAFERVAQERLDPNNYEVKAKLNIGGFNVGLSSKDGLNTDSLKEQAKDKIKTELIWYGIGCFIVLLVVIGLLGLGWYVWAEYKKGSKRVVTSTGTVVEAADSKGAVTWDGKAPLVCAGNDKIRGEKFAASFQTGPAITAGGNCSVELVSVDITSPTGIEASGNATVSMKGGSLSAKTQAAKAQANASIRFSGTKVTGKTEAKGGAKIEGP